MGLTGILRRGILLVLFINSICGVVMAAETACIGPAEYRRLSQRYADLFSKFDLTSVAQKYVDISVDAEDLKADINTCRKNISETDQQRCNALEAQYETKASQIKDLEHRFYAALNMQEYLLTLKLKLEELPCGK
jgi:hypothetical protein